MDWLGTSSEAESTVEVAVVKVEATVPVTDPSYGGAVVLNPGMHSPISSMRPRAYDFLFRQRDNVLLLNGQLTEDRQADPVGQV